MQTDPTSKVEQKQKQLSAIIIANPTSGTYVHFANQLKEIVSKLQRQGWQAELCLTHQAGDAKKYAKEAVQKQLTMVVAAGGDGTINEVIQELAGSETSLGVLPLGTVNVWAREMKIPLDDPTRASQILMRNYTRRVDLGKVNERYFLLMAGIGLDGKVTNAVEKRPAKKFGIVGYLFVALWMGLGFKGFPATLDIDGTEIKSRALQIVIGNTQLYGGAVKFTWRARADDGKLDICVVRARGLLGRLRVIMSFLLRRKDRIQWVTYHTGERLEIQTKTPIAIQIDGDPVDFTTPATFRVVPSSLRVVIPEEVAQELLSGAKA